MCEPLPVELWSVVMPHCMRQSRLKSAMAFFALSKMHRTLIAEVRRLHLIGRSASNWLYPQGLRVGASFRVHPAWPLRFTGLQVIKVEMLHQVGMARLLSALLVWRHTLRQVHLQLRTPTGEGAAAVRVLLNDFVRIDVIKNDQYKRLADGGMYAFPRLVQLCLGHSGSAEWCASGKGMAYSSTQLKRLLGAVPPTCKLWILAQQRTYTYASSNFLWKWRQLLSMYHDEIDLGATVEGKGILHWILEWHGQNLCSPLPMQKKYERRMGALFLLLSSGEIWPNWKPGLKRKHMPLPHATLPSNTPFVLPTNTQEYTADSDEEDEEDDPSTQEDSSGSDTDVPGWAQSDVVLGWNPEL